VKSTYDVIIIGAGAAGLMCAAEARRRQRRVLIIEKANKPGRKILMSGGGKCNFTNLHICPEAFISNNPHFAKSALSRYTQLDFIEQVKQHRIPYHEKKLGQLFCDRSSKDILNMLLKQIGDSKIQLNSTVLGIKQEQSATARFQVSTNNGTFDCQSLVIATGGLSIPSMGTTPLAYQTAEQFGLRIQPLRAALVPFTLYPHDKKRLESLRGVSASCTVSNHSAAFCDDMLFTHRGISGPAMLQLSSYWSPGETLQVHFAPEHDIYSTLIQAQTTSPNTKIKSVLKSVLAKSIIESILDEKTINQAVGNTSKSTLESINNQLINWTITPCGTEGYRTAEVTLGGIDTNELSQRTMQAIKQPGLYFIGEAVDVTGWLGGYNFQWAWSSGWAAGQDA